MESLHRRCFSAEQDGFFWCPPGEREGPASERFSSANSEEIAALALFLTVQLSDAGALSGTTQAIAHILPKSVPNIAAYNQLHEGRNEDWQHVKTGQTAALPIDLLVTLPDKARSFISLRPATGGALEILSDGVPIGLITQRGVPVTFKPQSFGPGFARLGIVRFYVTGARCLGLRRSMQSCRVARVTRSTLLSSSE